MSHALATPNVRCSEPRLVQLSGGQLRLFLGRIPPSLSTLLNPGSFGKFSKYIYFWNLQPYMLFSVRSTLSWRNFFLLEDNWGLFFGRIPPSLSTLLNPGSFGKFSKYIYFLNLEPYMLFSVRSTLGWSNLFLLEDNCACFWAAFLFRTEL